MRIRTLCLLSLAYLGCADDVETTVANQTYAIVPDAGGDAGSGLAEPGKNRGGSNTQNVLPRNLLLGDLDADGMADLIQWSANKLFVTATAFGNHAGLFHVYTPAPMIRVSTGDFKGLGYDEVCVSEGGQFECYQPGPGGVQLELWFRQADPFASSDNIAVGDLDGDLKDDLLVTSATGAQKIWSVVGNALVARPDIDLSALAPYSPTLKQVRVGDFNGDHVADILLYAPGGAVRVFLSGYTDERITFHSYGLNGTNLFTSWDDVVTAKVNPGPSDEIVAHDVQTGATRVFGLGLPNKPLGKLNNVSLSPGTRANTRLMWARVRIDDNSDAQRDDEIIYDLSNDHLQLAQASSTVTGLSYDLMHDSPAPANHTGWPAIVNKPLLFLKCKLADVSTEPETDDFYTKLMLGPGGASDFWSASSYGAWAFTGTRMVPGWKQMNVTQAAYIAIASRTARVQKCLDTYTEPTTGFAFPVVEVNGQGSPGTDGLGRVLLTLNPSITFVAHETGHGLGFGHSYDDTDRILDSWSGPGEYFDNWDIMSAMNVFTFTGALGTKSGPELNAALRAKRGFIPEHRIRRLNVGDDVDVPMAALTRPEAEGALMVRVGTNDNDYLTVEYRVRDGFDLGIPRPGVLVHHVLNGRPYLVTTSAPTDRQYNQSGVSTIAGAKITVTVGDLLGFNTVVHVKVEAAP